MTKPEKKKKPRNISQKNQGGKKKKIRSNWPLLKRETYELYKAWRMLPKAWKGATPEQLESVYGIDDEEMQVLLGMKTQGEFAKHFNINMSTLSAWNARLEEDGLDHLDEIRKWANKLTKNVVSAHYQKLVKRFDPVSGDIWYKIVAGFNEKKLVEHSGKLSLLDLAKEIDDEERIAQKGNTKDTE